jgi:hypothetical protein
MKNLSKFAQIFQKFSELHHAVNDPALLDSFRPGSKSFCNIFKNLRKIQHQIELPNNIKELLLTDIGDVQDGFPLDIPFQYSEDDDLNDADYQGKDVELNQPKRGGSKKFYVYVKDPKSKKVKKVSFGDPNMSTKISDPDARKSFKARHNCEQKNDKTTPGYWSCRIARYPHLSGSKQKYTWW